MTLTDEPASLSVLARQGWSTVERPRKTNHVSRRTFARVAAACVVLGASLALSSGCGLLPAPSTRVARAAYLGNLPWDSPGVLEEFRAGLGEAGWVEGQNLAIDWHYTNGTEEWLPDLATKLVRAQPDILLTDNAAARVLQGLTSTIPIVLTGSGDPVAAGLVASLGHPGGNITGANPADLPVDQPTVFELQVNVRTMEALHLTIPPSVAPLVTNWIQ